MLIQHMTAHFDRPLRVFFLVYYVSTCYVFSREGGSQPGLFPFIQGSIDLNNMSDSRLYYPAIAYALLYATEHIKKQGGYL